MKKIYSLFLLIFLAGTICSGQESGMLTGVLHDQLTGEPLFGVKVSAAGFVTRTGHDGTFSFLVPIGSYDVFLCRYGLYDLNLENIAVINGDTVAIDTIMVPFPVGPAIVKQEDDGSAMVVTWHYSGPDMIEKSNENGEVDDFFLFNDVGSQVAGKYDCYYDNVVGGRIFVGDSNFPVPFLGSRFAVKIYDDEGMQGRPGNTLDVDTIVVDQYGWVGFDSQDAFCATDNFYMSMEQLQDAPECAPVGIATYPPGNHSMMKYQDYNWEQFPTGNVMIRPWVAKEHDSLKVVHYRVGRYSDFDPNGPPQSGSFSELATTESTYYADYAWGGLPEGWYCYAIKCVYNSGYSSDWIVSDNWYGFKYNAGVNVSMSDQSDPNAIYVSLAGYYPVNDVFATLTNMEGNAHFYEIPAGEYKLLAFKPRFDLFTVDTLVINNDTAFSGFVLQETRIPVDSLMVNPFTGVLEWKNANITQFDWNCGDQGICHEVTTSEIVLGVYSNWVLSCEFLYNAEFEQDYLDYSTDYGRTWAHILQLEPSPEAQKLEISLDSLTNQGGANTFRFQLRDNHGSPFYLDINSMSIWSPDINVDPESYQVILNSQEASWTDSISFLLPFLENDIVYQAGIAANYSTGLADTVFIEFTYHKLFAPENFALSYTGDSLLFTWSPPSGSWAAWSQEHDFPNAFKGYHLEMVTGNNIYHHYIYDCFDTSLTLFHSGCDTVRATMTAVYDLNDYGYPGDTVESQPTGPIEFNGTGAFLDKLEEEWSSLTFSANCWNTNGQGLSIRPDEGNPGAAFVFRNSNDPYIAFLESNPIILKPITDGPQVLEFDLKLETDSQSGNDALEAQVRSDGSGIWIMVQGVNTIHGSIDWMHFRLYLEENLFSDKFSIRFLFYGSGEDETIWTIDNIRLHNLCPGPATFNAQRASDTEVFLSWGGMTQGYSAGRSLASYNIYRKYDQEEFTLLAETTDSIYIDTVSAGGQYCYQVSAIYNDNGTLCESPLTDSSCVISYLGFEENQPTDRIRVYPNPSRDHLVISCADENIQSLMIYNSIGIIREIKGDDKKEMILSLKDLVPGIYFIRINLEDEFYLEKIILLD